jgi:serine/threonine protein kinase
MYYMVMEYIAGKDLAHLMKESGAMPLSQTLPFLHDVASALDYAHAQGLVHRDIKPSNVMLDPLKDVSEAASSFRAVLSDFGIVRLTGGGAGMTKTAMMGTLDYMAPEQIRSAGDVDGRADVYALGVMAYQMLTGQLPFASENAGAVLIAHLQQPAPDPRLLAPDLTAEAGQALQRALAKRPEDRFQTAGEFVRALER